MPLLLRIVGLTALFAVIALELPADSQAISPFDPGGFTCFEDFESQPECDGDPSPGASPDIRFRVCLGWDDLCAVKDGTVADSAPAFLAGFLPVEFGVANGADLPLGAIVGRAGAEQTLSILNNPCNTSVTIAWTMLNGSINTADVIDASDAAAVFLDGDGNGIQDGVDRYPSFLNEIVGAQPLARYVGVGLSQGLVYMVNAVFLDPGSFVKTRTGTLHFDSSLGYPLIFVLGDPTAEPVPGPISDYCAPLMADLVLFGSSMDNPCTPTPVSGAACPGGGTPIFQTRGYPLLPCETGNAYDEDGDGKINDGCPQAGTVAESGAGCENNTSDDGEDSSVNDGCPQVGPLSEAERLPGTCAGGDDGGCALLHNPSQPGTYDVTAFSVGYHDADGDGIENPLDVCPLAPNPAWNPRATNPASDPDNDGLPNDCDPDPNVTSPQVGCHPVGLTGPDEDLDCYSNRQDNCPLVAQLPNPAELPSPSNPPYQDDIDGDGIGDACDPNPQTPDGERPAACLTMPVQVAAGASTAPSQPTKDLSGFACVGGFSPFPQDPDIDRDGICAGGIDPGDSGCTGVDNCPFVPNPSQVDSDSDGVGDACENQPPIAVGGIAGLVPEARLPSGSNGGGTSATLPFAAAIAATGALAFSVSTWFAVRRRC